MINQNLYKLLDYTDDNTMYTFNQHRDENVYVDEDFCIIIFYNKYVFKVFYFCSKYAYWCTYLFWFTFHFI